MCMIWQSKTFTCILCIRFRIVQLEVAFFFVIEGGGGEKGRAAIHCNSLFRLGERKSLSKLVTLVETMKGESMF